MSGIDFHNTGYGRKFFEHDLPELIKALNRLSEATEKANALKEKEEKEGHWQKP